MAYERSAGPCATAKYSEYKSYQKWDNGTKMSIDQRTVTISGTGKVEKIDVPTWPNSYEDVVIEEGITEIADECFNSHQVRSIKLPSTLKKIGNRCFASSSIRFMELPEGLEEIGTGNFPDTLCSINIPDSLKTFPISNIGFSRLTTIEIGKNHPTYLLYKNILYNREMTEMLFCPRNRNTPVNIPPSVIRIGDHCFAGAKEIPLVMIPASVKHIGKRAFAGMNLQKLYIPHSVESIGERCFYDTEISDEFRFSQNITELPKRCFAYSKLPSMDFIDNIRIFGEECLSRMDSKTSPVIYRLGKAERIESRAFSYNKDFDAVELYPCLKYVGDSVFDGTKDNLTVWSFSYVPMPLNDDAFSGQSHVTLCVPEHTAIIYKYAGAWGTFCKIKEMSPSKEGALDAIRDASLDVYKCHLKGIYDSMMSVNRAELAEILNHAMMYYSVIADDRTYEELLELLKYNRMFNPPIIPDYEGSIQASWNDLYKLKMIEHALTNPLLLPLQRELLLK